MPRAGIFRVTFCGVAAAVAACAGAAEPSHSETQQRVNIEPRRAAKTAAHDRSRLRLDVRLVLVPVTVIDGTDRPVLDLPSKSFRVFEDNVEQKIVSFALEEGPVSIGFVFDASSSMRTRMAASIKAMQQFLKTANPEDEFLMVTFSDKASLATGFTRDSDEILSTLSAVQPAGWTALHDAICLAVQRMKGARNPRRALVVLTDGADNNSRYSEGEVRSLVRESDIRVYSIGIFERSRLLENLAADTGSRAFRIHRLEDLPKTIEQLSRELRTEYVLGYSSNNLQKDGKYRKVRVEVMESPRRLPLNIFWRRGYFAPAD